MRDWSDDPSHPDAVDQRRPLDDGTVLDDGPVVEATGDPLDANDADRIEQAAEVPLDDEDYPPG